MKKNKSPTKNSTSSKKQPETGPIRGLILFCFSIAIFMSLISFSYHPAAHNWIGLMGYSIGKVLHALFGIGSYLLALYLGWIGWRQFFQKPINHPIIKTLCLFTLVISLCLLLSLVEDRIPALRQVFSDLFYPYQKRNNYHLGGALFYYLYRDLPFFNLLHIFNAVGVALLATTTFLASLLFLTKTTPSDVLKAIKAFIALVRGPSAEPDLEGEREETDRWVSPAPQGVAESSSRLVKLKMPNVAPLEAAPAAPVANKNSAPPPADHLEIEPEKELRARPSLSQKAQTDKRKESGAKGVIEREKEVLAKEPPELKANGTSPAQKKREAAVEAQRVYNGDFKNYKLPPASMLTVAKKVDQSSLKLDLKRQAEVLEETLQSFGIEAKVGQINCGPSITSFEVHPAIGVKVQKIKALENDIALNMEAKSLRIIAPIPGKAAVGIEVPNPQPQEVGFRDMLAAYQQGANKLFIPILLGKAVTGDYVMSDLAKMPHCIIAGATGSGKSVCINTIVMAIVMNAKPDEIKLIMVDPKKVELTPYTKLPHMLAPVITEPQGACAALNWLVKEMENRYEILKQLGVRNIQAFNTRVINKELEEALDREIPDHMPYIVTIIDELADLMMVSSNDIETPIARLAQMARAVGIHLILATQRPSREVITGLIKANFPTRISFKVASRINSQIILDEVGAESLLGNGDMLFLPPGTSTLVRAQGAFIRDSDIADVVKFVCDQAPPNYVIASFDDMAKSYEEAVVEKIPAGDSLYEQGVDVVLSTGNASTTFLQRKLKIGYARAASLIDEMEQKGVVGPAEGSKPRKILAAKASEELGVES